VEVESTQGDSFSFVESEHQVLKFWKEKKIFKKSLDQTLKKDPYIFYDGPPFATGLPHHGHLVGSVLKDVIPRYFTMKGRYVERRFGWDCHGLPIEHEIDKKLGMSAGDAVKKLGVKAYNDECRAIVQRYTSEWEKTISRIGRWVDFENDYKTMDAPFMESVWWVFKELWNKDLLYEGVKVVPYSTALETVLSNFEAGQNYQDVQDPAVTVLFKAEGKDFYFAAWTTTPWTLPSNLGLCMGAEIEYSIVQDLDLNKKIVMASALVENFGKKRKFQVLEAKKGSEFKGMSYEPLLPYFKDFKKEGAFKVYNDNYVTTDSGTGIVHLAPSFGEDDNRVMKEAGVLLQACPINTKGEFTSEVNDFAGVYVKEADKQIIKKLKDEGKLFDQSTIVHSYPFCYRSDTPLIYRAIPSWYVRVEKLRDKLLKSNHEINWVPDHIKEGRFGKWLEGARDWSISRNRVWGTPLPIWKNEESGKCICLGSIAEVAERTGVKLTDLHRENVDPLTFTVAGEKGVYRRITDVLDCWFESGSMPYAQIHYPFENQEMFKKGFPAEFIAEGLDQTRGWFYTLTVLSTALFERPAFKNVIVNGIVMAGDGKKMSKRLKNYTPPDELMEEYGADALRLYLINSGLVKAEEQRFTDAGVKDMVRRALLPWYNSFKFFSTYAAIDGWKADKNYREGKNITDRWILSNLQTLKKNIQKEMVEYKLYNVVPALFTFIEDLTNWYIRLNRSRFWGDGLNDDKCEAYSTLYTTIKELSESMAPFAPFLAETIFQELRKFDSSLSESVHLVDYPVPVERFIDPKLEEAMGRMQQIILLGRQKRNLVQIKVKTPLRRLTVIHKDGALLKEISKLENYIKSELNIKTVDYSQEESKFIKLYAKPNSPVLGKKLGKDFAKYRGLLEKLDAVTLASYEDKGSLKVDGVEFVEGDILVFREAKEGTQSLSNKLISIDMDCELSEELVSEGWAREIVSRIQKTRKDLKLNIDDRIAIEYTVPAGSHLSKALTTHQEHIKRETLAKTLVSSNTTAKSHFEEEIDGENLKLWIIKA
jgi:isoleucyl-tRNA synthetase